MLGGQVGPWHTVKWRSILCMIWPYNGGRAIIRITKIQLLSLKVLHTELSPNIGKQLSAPHIVAPGRQVADALHCTALRCLLTSAVVLGQVQPKGSCQYEGRGRGTSL